MDYQGGYSTVLPGGTLLHKGYYDLLGIIPTPRAAWLWRTSDDPSVGASRAAPVLGNTLVTKRTKNTGYVQIADWVRDEGKRVSKDMISSPIGFAHLVHASDIVQAEVLLKRWGPDGQGKIGDPSWAAPIKQVVRAKMQERAIAEVVSNMRTDVIPGASHPPLRVVNGGSSLITSTTGSVPPVPQKDVWRSRNAIDGLPHTAEDRAAAMFTLARTDEGNIPTLREGFRPRTKSRPIVPSLITLEKAVSARIYFENLYFPLLRQPPSREQRRVAFEKDLDILRIDEAHKEGLRERWRKNETDYLRERRRKIDVSGFIRLKTIGHGAFGVVYLVREKRTGELYAMKQARSNLMRKTDMLRKGQEGHVRAEREVLKAAALAGSSRGTDGIVRLFYRQVFQDQDSLYLVLEFMAGGDLLNLLIERDIMEEGFTKFYVAEMILCIEQCHKHGFIHRDIKPDNFLFDREGHLKLSDFGLATDLHWAHETSYYEQQRKSLLRKYGIDLADRNDFDDSVPSRRLDPKQVENIMGGEQGREGIFTWRERNRKKVRSLLCGTNSYMSPEVIRGQGYGYSCDYWSLGVIMYECLFGYPPFISRSRHTTRQKILNWKQTLRFPARPRVSSEAIDLIQRLICEPEDRLGGGGVIAETFRTRGSRLTSGSQGRGEGYYRRGGSNFAAQPVLGTFDGAGKIKAHPWFRGIDFKRLRDRPAPYTPTLSSAEDTRHFEQDIEPEVLPPLHGRAADAPDPILRDAVHGPAALGIRKAYAFAGFTHKSPRLVDVRKLRVGRDSRVMPDGGVGDRGRVGERDDERERLFRPMSV
ncbi:kinase-like protein [Dacryopinax primogenitus]|uniref:non-specific serine/threonine protein kinase n=1 Tax=Dacryopinax primogenitus (strain DJM 731) TaxID=1858805 RepID=M5G0F0_DACPD|nr:kinase-like protein [Dacryopinax primogenitus]EJT97277.1 kinase-like protein [Dacryopinax primogenitus]